MAFLFDSTVGGSSSNSYVSVESANDYFEAHLDGEQWKLPASKKQAALTMATNRINRERFSGAPTTTSQRLQWPRSYVVSKNSTPYAGDVNTFAGGNYFVDNTIIPLELEQATYELALFYIKKADGQFTANDDELETLESMKIGPLDVKYKSSARGDRLPQQVKDLLSSIGTDAWLGLSTIRFTA